jgi:CheY-like chemotaxis protein
VSGLYDITSDADVLVVDFFDWVRTFTASSLRRMGFTVVEADNGDTAYELLSQNYYRLLLLDLDLPFRNGLELLDSIENLPQVVVCTGLERSPFDHEVFARTVTRCLRKPVQPALLTEVVAGMLGARRLPQL